MSEITQAYPVVLNLTSTPERFAPDVDLVERELKRLMDENQVMAVHDEAVMPVGPRRDGREMSGYPNDAELRHRLHEYFKGRLSTLKFVLLVDRWPESVEGGIQEPLGVYLADLSDSCLQGMKNALGASSSASEELKEACLAVRRSSGADQNAANGVKVPAVALLMESIVDESSRQWWYDLTECSGRSWLTKKVLHHELGHHVFPLDEEIAKRYGKDDHVTQRAEAGANWYAWLVGSPNEREILKRFSDDQTPPYRTYRELIEWASAHPITPGAAWGVQVLMKDILGALVGDSFRESPPPERWSRAELEALIQVLPDFLKANQTFGQLRALYDSAAANDAAHDVLRELGFK